MRRVASFRLIAQSVLNPILRLRVLNGLPLHVAGIVGATALQGNHMVHNESRASASGLTGGWTRVCALESSPLRRIALDPAAPGINCWSVLPATNSITLMFGTRFRFKQTDTRPCKIVESGHR
jgi:hypothetical protein